jgi:hypothetical protein
MAETLCQKLASCNTVRDQRDLHNRLRIKGLSVLVRKRPDLGIFTGLDRLAHLHFSNFWLPSQISSGICAIEPN